MFVAINYPSCLTTQIKIQIQDFFLRWCRSCAVKKGESSNKILSYHGMTNRKLADFIRVPLGGTKLPVKDKNIDLALNYIKVEDSQKLD